MLKKRISKSIAIALAGITIAAPMLSTRSMDMEKTSKGRGMYLKIGPGVFTFGTL